MENTNLTHKQQMLLEAVRKLVRRGATPNLDRLFARRRPVEIAALFNYLNDWESKHLANILIEYDLVFGAKVLCDIDQSISTSYIVEMPKERLVQIISAIPADDAANLLRLLPEETASEIVPLLKAEMSEEVEELLGYASDTAGGLMSPDFFALHEDSTVAQAIEALQKAGDSLEMAFYLYVINSAEQLVGVLSLRSLLMVLPETLLKKIMITEVLSVDLLAHQADVAQMVARYNLLAIPVVDDYNKLVGIVTVDDVIDVIQEEATGDLLKLVGAPEEQPGERSTRKSIKTRAPWVIGTLIAGLLASEIIRIHQDTLKIFVLLAGFIPVMVGLAGNAGNQSATLTAHGISLSRIEARVLWSHLFSELKVGIILGIICAISLILFIFLRYNMLHIALSVGLSAFIAVLTAVAFGTISPLLLHRLDLEPGFATGPFVSMIVDLIGITIYFSISTYIFYLFGVS